MPHPNRTLTCLITFLAGPLACWGSETESPVIYTGTATVTTAADGGLPWAIGTHNIQTYRGNRTHPAHETGLEHTYLHAPMLAYWEDQFMLAYLSAPVNEHDAPTDTSFQTSKDGVHWSAPQLLFPAYELPDGSMTITHQRMVWYVAPDGRLLATAFHGEAPSPNDGTGIGRVVREVHKDGSLGPIYWIRLNQQPGWDSAKADVYPMYTDSDDEGFVAACRDLLDDKLMTAQWWEEDRSEDGFYRVKGKALAYYERPDGKVVGVWKDAQISITDDAGESWTRTGFGEGLEVNGSKYWAQATEDGRYALVYNPTTRLRHPLAVMTSGDGQHFSNLLAVHGQLPDQRYPGLYKNMGPQYVRGILPGNGNPPGDDMWLTYSVNKEDIWVSKVPVPVSGKGPSPQPDEFEQTPHGKMPASWNIYRPLWAPVQVIDAGGEAGHVLELVDEDPVDYAVAARIFPEHRSVKVTFQLRADRLDGRLEVDLQSADGQRPVQIAFTEEGKIESRHEGVWKPGGSYETDRWFEVELDVNPGSNTERFQLRIDGQEVLYRAAYFTDYPETVERLVFRTGTYRGRGQGGHEIPGADDKAPTSRFLVDDVTIELRD
jgi:hypothetical protein